MATTLDAIKAARAQAAMEAAESARNIRKKITALKGHFTRSETRIMQLKCRASEELVTSFMSELNGKAEQILDIYDDLLEVCPKVDLKAHTDAMKKTDDDMNRRQVACQTFVLTLPKSNPSASAPSISSTPAVETPKVVFREQQGLRPQQLLFSSPMIDFTKFKSAYEAYLQASNMHLLGETEQLAYLYGRVDSELDIRLRGMLGATATLRQCFEALDRVFLERHPLFARRLSWFQYEKSKDVPARQYFYHLKQMADEADMTNGYG